MKYVKMTIEEALNYYNGSTNETVLVAVQNLETDDEIVSFNKKTKSEGEEIIEKAETIARVYDDFINQLKVFTHKQVDIMNIEQRGKLSTILLKE